MEPYLAHLASDGREQPLLDHLEGTARRAAQFAAAFDAEEQGRLAGLAHDLGKYSHLFQQRLRGGPKVDHATAGAFVCLQQGQPFAAFAIAGHHSGLPDGGSQGDAPTTGSFLGRINRALQGKLPSFSPWTQELTLPSPPLPNLSALDGMFFTRTLYSCLVDADYTDTADFMAESSSPTAPVPTIEALWERLRNYIAGWFPPKGPLNTQRCAILDHCIQEGLQRDPGLFTLTVPTGGGKTVASLAFALAQAQSKGLRRVIYVIPYTSIIEQTAQTFRDILGEEAVLEHHSGVSYDLQDEATPEALPLAQATETWDLPVVVTTAVQFFESLFSARPASCRKLHNLAGSVIVFDEAQMLPVSYLRPCVWAMAQLVAHYHVSAVLCTATQPALQPLFQEFAPQLTPVELCPPDTCRWEVFQRVTFQNAGKLTWDALACRLQAKTQVLCVVNTRAGAQAVFQRLQREDSFHLSTLMYPAHRRRQLAEIRRRLTLGLPCRVVSTSLIEAGVDVDFPAVYREEAGLDSLLQAAGRCNREGHRPAQESVVTLFQGEGNAPPLFAPAIGAGRYVMARHTDLASPEAIHDYFRELLDLKGTQAQDIQNILPTMADNRFPFRTVAERFHLIEDHTVTVYIPQDEGAALVERLQAGECSRALFRKLGQYGVSIYPQHAAALTASGDLAPWGEGVFLLQNLDAYDSKTGLSLQADCGKGLFL